MVLLKATHKDIENLVESASVAKPYLVYSNKKGNPNLRDSYNIYKDEKVYIRWANKEDKDSVILLILDEKKTKDIINMIIEARTKGGLTKFENLFYTILQPYIKELNESIGLKNDEEEKHAPTVSKQSNIKASVSKPKEPTKVEAKIEVVKEVDPYYDVKKRFKDKYSYYVAKKDAIIDSTYIDNRLQFEFDTYTGDSHDMLTNSKRIKSVSKLDLELVTIPSDDPYYTTHHFVPKGCSYLLLGDLKTDFYEKFKEDENKLNHDIEKTLELSNKTSYLLREIDVSRLADETFETIQDMKGEALDTLKYISDNFDEVAVPFKNSIVGKIKKIKFGKILNRFIKNKSERG